MDLKIDENVRDCDNLQDCDAVYPTTEVLKEVSCKIIEENIQAYKELAK